MTVYGHAQYNFYYGNIHAHSSYSDGNDDAATSGCSTPFQDFQYAKLSQHFDFLGISEHNHFQAGMHRADYAKGLHDADSANADGTFISMYGMEWGVIGPPGGHAIVYGVNQLIGWDTLTGNVLNYDVYNAKADYNGLFTKIARTPGAFATLAHPASSDYNDLFSTSVNPTWDSAITGCAIRSGPAFSVDTTYNDPSTSTSYEARYKDALKRGYHIGATLDHDNHNTTFGRMAASRTVILANSLTRSNVIDAFLKMRTQASEDWNVKVTFTINGRPLGSNFIDTSNAVISVSVVDPDLENTSSIVVTYGIPGSGTNPTTLISNANSSSLTYTHAVTTGATYYYYVVVTQTDGNKIFTSPIWFNKVSVLPVRLLAFKAKAAGEKINCSWDLATPDDVDHFVLERSNNLTDFHEVATIPVVHNHAVTSYSYADLRSDHAVVYYRLKEAHRNGTFAFSGIVAVEADKTIPEIELSPNPFTDKVFIQHNFKDAEVLTELFNTLGEVVYSRSIKSQNGEIGVNDLGGLPDGLYLIRLSSREGSVVKRVKKNH